MGQYVDRSQKPLVRKAINSGKYRFSPVTRTRFPQSATGELEFHAANCEKLATLLENQKAIHFDMGSWGAAPAKHSCGSVGCALGIAAMSGEFKGLQYKLDIDAYLPHDSFGATDRWDIDAVVNGKDSGWFEVAELFFGKPAYHRVFTGRMRQKAAVVKALRSIAREYRAEAKVYA